MRVSRETATAHRAAMVTAAGRLFRRHGIGGVGVAEITRAAGLTHGGFYGHFASKEALAREALAAAFAEGLERLRTAPDLAAWIRGYLSRAHRDAPEEGCVMVALSAEANRGDAELAAIWRDGFEAFVIAIAGRLPRGGEERHTRQVAISLIALSVGAMALARATAAVSPEASDEILRTARAQALALAAA